MILISNLKYCTVDRIILYFVYFGVFCFSAGNFPNASRIMCSLTFLVETTAHTFLIYQTLALLATIAQHVLGILRRAHKHSRAGHSHSSALRRVELDLRFQRASSLAKSWALLRSRKYVSASRLNNTRMLIAFGPALIASTTALSIICYVHSIVDDHPGHLAECETVDLSPKQNLICAPDSKIQDELHFENLNMTYLDERNPSRSSNTSIVFLTNTPLVSSSTSSYDRYKKKPTFSLNICVPSSTAVALIRVTFVLLLPCLLAFLLIFVFCYSTKRLQSLMRRPKTRENGLNSEILEGITTRYTGDSRPAKWCISTEYLQHRQPPTNNTSINDPQLNNDRETTAEISYKDKNKEDALSDDGPWVRRQRVQLVLSEMPDTSEKHTLVSQSPDRQSHFRFDDSTTSNRKQNRQSIRVKERRTVRRHPQEQPLAVSIRRNHSSLNRDRPAAKVPRISFTHVPQLRALRSNLLYLSVLTLLLSPSYVGSATILLFRELIQLPDPLSYPQSNLQLHPLIQNLQLNPENKILYFFCWLINSPETSLALYSFHLLATTISALFIFLLLLSQEKALAHVLRKFLKAPIAFYRESSTDLNARLRLRNASISGSRYGSLHGSGGRNRTRFIEQFEVLYALVRSPQLEMRDDHGLSSPILDFRRVSAV